MCYTKVQKNIRYIECLGYMGFDAAPGYPEVDLVCMGGGLFSLAHVKCFGFLLLPSP